MFEPLGPSDGETVTLHHFLYNYVLSNLRKKVMVRCLLNFHIILVTRSTLCVQTKSVLRCVDQIQGPQSDAQIMTQLIVY